MIEINRNVKEIIDIEYIYNNEIITISHFIYDVNKREEIIQLGIDNYIKNHQE